MAYSELNLPLLPKLCYSPFSACLNLAQVYLKTKKYTMAVDYCDRALKLDKNSVKGYYRRAMVSLS